MVAPAVMFIEQAAEELKALKPFIRAAQFAELESFGNERVRNIVGAAGLTADFALGYQLGLQTMRVIHANNGDSSF